MNRFMTVGFAAALAVAAGCGNTADGMKKDSKDAADDAAQATSSVGASVDAAMETADVKSALIADTRLDASDINVDTNKETKTVTLNGTVPADSMKTLAEDVAKAKAPEWTVVNNLTIKPK
ncbi:MAG: BON domain-containing protein [Gemmatimonadota bacterium]